MKNLARTDAESILGRAKRGQYSEALRELAEINGELDPRDVLDEARDESSPLHQAFTWDDSLAGEKYRLMEARLLINSVKVEIQGERRPAFYNTRVVIGGTERAAYFPVERVLTDKEVHAAVIRDAVRDLRVAQRKYDALQELKGVINEPLLRKIEEEVGLDLPTT